MSKLVKIHRGGVPSRQPCSGIAGSGGQKILASPKESVPPLVIVRLGNKVAKGFEHLYLRLFRQAFE